MIYLSGAAHAGIEADGIGFMLTPNFRLNSAIDLSRAVWAADTGLFSAAGVASFDLDVYRGWLAKKAPYRASCLFATAPDVVSDFAATLRSSAPVLPEIRDLGFRAALCFQDGATAATVPWSTFDAAFFGGSDRWRFSEPFCRLVREARDRGVWCHMGRVNARRRILACAALGFDSVDGTHLRFRRDERRAQIRRWMAHLDGQGIMEGVQA